jgi:hypothetical protein
VEPYLINAKVEALIETASELVEVVEALGAVNI